MIVCASRRTDIPAFHAEWLMNRLREGYALVRNPVAKSVVHRVDLSPRNMDLLVLMTKDPRPMLPFMEELMDMGVNLLFQVTVTPYGRDIEPGVPGKADVAEAFREVSRAIGRDRVVWRYDPVILNDRLDVGYHRRKFGAILGELGGYTDRCVVGFVEMHGKLRHLSDQGTIRGVSPEEADGIGRALSEAARGSGIELTSCCSPHDLSRHGIQPRGCIGRELMAA
ncbi:MAG: DUF1848 domain-containing protein, partial [Methanomassiliicoccaceae archaeon]|nr:DUF1848 domain-containing protein [Methanomassiliicoccaceae archaeon]